MALTVGSYAWPAQAHAVAVAAVVALTAINYVGVRQVGPADPGDRRGVLAVLAAVVVAVLYLGRRSGGRLESPDASAGGVLQAAGLLFFAFAGYARIATLGEEVRDPARDHPASPSRWRWASPWPCTPSSPWRCCWCWARGRLADCRGAAVDAVRAAGVGWLVPVVRVGAAVAALGSLLALILGVSRTTLAMARDRHLPHALAAVHPRFEVPHRAELLIGAVVAVVAATADVRGAIGFSSFAVLVYYAIANASAFTLGPDEGRPRRPMPVVGLAGCVVLAFALPLPR